MTLSVAADPERHRKARRPGHRHVKVDLLLNGLLASAAVAEGLFELTFGGPIQERLNGLNTRHELIARDHTEANGWPYEGELEFARV